MSQLPRPLLTFKMSMSSARLSTLIVGRLYFQDTDRKQREFEATSGLPMFQYKNSWKLPNHGPIPPCNARNEELYQVTCKPVNLDTIVGITGKFYAINPTNIKIGGVNRGHFGIHWDANVPGTQGCIGLRNPSHWHSFQDIMREYASLFHAHIPLLVIYP